jgi:hypothetical protein
LIANELLELNCGHSLPHAHRTMTINSLNTHDFDNLEKERAKKYAEYAKKYAKYANKYAEHAKKYAENMQRNTQNTQRDTQNTQKICK